MAGQNRVESERSAVRAVEFMQDDSHPLQQQDVFDQFLQSGESLDQRPAIDGTSGYNLQNADASAEEEELEADSIARYPHAKDEDTLSPYVAVATVTATTTDNCDEATAKVVNTLEGACTDTGLVSDMTNFMGDEQFEKLQEVSMELQKEVSMKFDVNDWLHNGTGTATQTAPSSTNERAAVISVSASDTQLPPENSITLDNVGRNYQRPECDDQSSELVSLVSDVLQQSDGNQAIGLSAELLSSTSSVAESNGNVLLSNSNSTYCDVSFRKSSRRRGNSVSQSRSRDASVHPSQGFGVSVRTWNIADTASSVSFGNVQSDSRGNNAIGQCQNSVSVTEAATAPAWKTMYDQRNSVKSSDFKPFQVLKIGNAASSVSQNTTVRSCCRTVNATFPKNATANASWQSGLKRHCDDPVNKFAKHSKSPEDAFDLIRVSNAVQQIRTVLPTPCSVATSASTSNNPQDDIITISDDSQDSDTTS